MADQGPADTADIETASPKGGWTPSRGFWVGMASVIIFAGVLAAAGAVAATRDSEPVTAPQAPPPPVEITTVPRQVTPEPDFAAEVGGALGAPSVTAADAGTASAASVAPDAVASSWSAAPVIAPPAPAAPAGASAAWLAQQVSELYGMHIVLEGQDWGADEEAQVRNIGAVISAMDMLPRRVVSAIAANPAGPLAVLSNGQGRTQDGWQPYGEIAMNFYANSDNGTSGYHPANQVVLATGADQASIAHEVLHAYQFRNAGPDEYALALLGSEMKSFMTATGWHQTVGDDTVRDAAHEPWSVINNLFTYEGRPLTYVAANGDTVSLSPANPIEAFATAGALYYTSSDGSTLPAWPEYWAWFDANLD